MDAIGRYPVERVLGAGAFATVWLGRDDRLDSYVAIKVLADNWSAEPAVRERFVKEARLLRHADSPRIVQVHDIGELPDGRPYFVMTYADMGSLAGRVLDGPLPLLEALRVLGEIAEGVTVLHRLGIVHRDLKPSNVLFRALPGGGERLMVADLGVARSLADATSHTIAAGSPGYMAPEQMRLDGAPDERADVHGLGAMAYHLLTGRLPASGSVRPAPHRLRPEVPVRVGAAIMKAIDPDPDRRWPSITSFAAALCARDDAPPGDGLPEYAGDGLPEGALPDVQVPEGALPDVQFPGAGLPEDRLPERARPVGGADSERRPGTAHPGPTDDETAAHRNTGTGEDASGRATAGADAGADAGSGSSAGADADAGAGADAGANADAYAGAAPGGDPFGGAGGGAGAGVETGAGRGKAALAGVGAVAVALVVVVAVLTLRPTDRSSTASGSPAGSPGAVRTPRASEPESPKAGMGLRANADIPPQYRALIIQAGTWCHDVKGLSPALVAGVVKAASDFDPNLSDPVADEYGIARWTPRVLQYWQPNGINDPMPKPPFSPELSLPAMGRFFCGLGPQIADVPGDPAANLAALYVSGVVPVRREQGVPSKWKAHVQQVLKYRDQYQS
ncbi:serine/threonine-protein kinase [Nonomuraea sp. NPDC050680]|uniref:serine/threonine-protein kinase n=1 Tax=Nonomuraea sp. NPDC050680 TaxID=3154630 RepID=UPI0033F1DC0A